MISLYIYIYIDIYLYKHPKGPAMPPEHLGYDMGDEVYSQEAFGSLGTCKYTLVYILHIIDVYLNGTYIYINSINL